MNLQEADKHFIHTYNRSVIFEKGEGMYLFDNEGNKYLDMGAGIAVSALGYSNEEYKQALKDQIDKLIHVSNLYYTEPSIKAAEYLSKASGMDKVFFTNSGTEAIEGAIKLARKYAYNKDKNSKGEIIAMNHSFHGRSMGALSVTGTKHYREPFEPLIGGVSFAEYNDLESVKKLATKDTCAVILETLQGEGGIYPATDEFITGLRKFCDENDILLIFDEIQCGMGRTGKMYTYQHYGVKPDIMTSAKALGCGVPVGAFAATKEVADAMCPGDHGTTFGGNPFATAAGLAVFDIFEKEHLVENAGKMGKYFKEKLTELQNKYSDKITDVRNAGLLIGIQLEDSIAKTVFNKLFENKMLTSLCGGNTIRIAPPLIIKETDIDLFINTLSSILEEL